MNTSGDKMELKMLNAMPVIVRVKREGKYKLAVREFVKAGKPACEVTVPEDLKLVRTQQAFTQAIRRLGVAHMVGTCKTTTATCIWCASASHRVIWMVPDGY